MLPGRMADLPPSGFRRLHALLDGIAPKSFAAGGGPLALTVGEPQDAPPAFVAEIVARHATEFSKYPPVAGTSGFRAACGAWLERRYHLPAGALDPHRQILPLNGSREGLFFAPIALMPERKAGERPVVLLPNPFYGVYPAGILAAGAEPYYVPARRETGFLPDVAAVPDSILRRTAAAYFCSPSNPESACASEEDWARLFALADRYDFVVLADECYADIYDAVPPAGALPVRLRPAGRLDRLLSFHSLSKRSNLAGLRSGFVAGDARLIERLYELRNVAAPQVPIPVMEASAAVWADDAHVEAGRALYRQRFAIARRVLGNRPGFRLPQGGFYLWLHVGDGEAAARLLWQEAGLRVMPGAYMARDERAGDADSNPGKPFIRVALVHDLVTIAAALERMADVLEKRERI